MEFTTRLRTWLTRHPLKTPSDIDRAHYTTEVMAKVRAVTTAPAQAPQRVWRPHWLSWPQLALVVATAAGIVVIVSTAHSSREQLAHRLTQDAQMLAEVDEPLPELLNGEEAAELAQDLEEEDHHILLAESAPSQDQQWLDQTLQLLDQLDEEVPGVDSDQTAGNDDEEWLKELDTLDNGSSATSS